MHTIESVKEQLPKVKVELGDKTVVEGVLSGRLNIILVKPLKHRGIQ